jgi:hypothetical protein
MKNQDELFKKEKDRVDMEIATIAGKPLDQLTEEEKQNVITQWVMLRNAPPRKDTVPYRVMNVLVYVTGFLFFLCLAAVSIKWLFTILGVI